MKTKPYLNPIKGELLDLSSDSFCFATQNDCKGTGGNKIIISYFATPRQLTHVFLKMNNFNLPKLLD